MLYKINNLCHNGKAIQTVRNHPVYKQNYGPSIFYRESAPLVGAFLLHAVSVHENEYLGLRKGPKK